jgi:hypothetical protein
MSRVRARIFTLSILIVALAASGKPILARNQYWMTLQKEVIQKKADSDNEADRDFAKAAMSAETGKCLFCHGKNERTGRYISKRHNTFGLALKEELPKFVAKRWTAEKDKCQKEFLEALAKVCGSPSDEKEKDSKTFGELMEENVMPGKDVPPPDDAGKEEDEGEEDSGDE